MLSEYLISHLGSILSEKIIDIKNLSGGDINEVFLLTTSMNKVVVKTNKASRYPRMFEAEAKGLQKLANSNTFTIPKVLSFGELKNASFLMMEYIDPGRRDVKFWEQFGRKLGRLHQQTQTFFGLEYDNYIGSLPQYNTPQSTASDFYITQRLQPQFDLAVEQGFLFSDLDRFYKNIRQEIPVELPSLLHGDLWNGNYLIDQQGLPCLIDPAVAYASREMDIAMMHLFGGFDSLLFDSYNEIYPLLNGWKKRLPIWQLYYLLVHLNLFGNSYYTSVDTIIKKYS